MRITIKRCLSYLKSLPAAVPVELKTKLCFANILQQVCFLLCQNLHGKSSGRKQKSEDFMTTLEGIIVIVLLDTKRTDRE